ncbi:uncharacterized protein [Battus philenor]|uniref:uncharacterized protein n=1 Tax=Battus philenor TaxID=42288 RepID=UPI0035D0F236
MSLTSLYWKIFNFYSKINFSIRITDAIQMVYDLCQYIVDLTFILIFGQDMSLEYFQQYGRIDNIIHMTYYSDIKQRLIKLMAFFALIWTMSSTCDFLAWLLSFGWKAPIIYSVAYVYLLIKILTTLDLISQVMHIECRLRCIGDLLLTYCNPKNVRAFDYCALKYICLRQNNKVSSHSPQNASMNIHDEIKLFRKYYLLLIEQTAFINNMYGLRILLNSLSLLIDMVRFANIAVRFIINAQDVIDTLDYFPAISSLMRLSTCVAVVISLVDHCEKAYRERDRLIWIIDHYLIMKDPSNIVRTEMKEFRDLVQSRAITFHMAYFFRFDYSLLVSIASAVVTYTIIILQSIK